MVGVVSTLRFVEKERDVIGVVMFVALVGLMESARVSTRDDDNENMFCIILLLLWL